MNTTLPSILQTLDDTYGEVKPFLQSGSTFQFLVAVILSAQTTDALVNTVTPGLFARYSTAELMAKAEVDDVAQLINKLNYYKTKAKNLVKMAQIVMDEFGGEVPQTMGELIRLPGVGRKVANVVMADAFGVSEGICVDTHVKRVSFRLGWTEHTSPDKVEQDLMKLWPTERWGNTPKQVILIGREYCFANKKPDCERCPLRKWCEKRI